jgi:hypothetical protein
MPKLLDDRPLPSKLPQLTDPSDGIGTDHPLRRFAPASPDRFDRLSDRHVEGSDLHQRQRLNGESSSLESIPIMPSAEEEEGHVAAHDANEEQMDEASKSATAVGEEAEAMNTGDEKLPSETKPINSGNVMSMSSLLC